MVGRYPTNKLIGRNPLPKQQPKPPFTHSVMPQRRPFGITHRFQRLFQSEGYVGYVLLTLSPLYLSEDVRARLACLIHTASVRSEPGSNPSVELIWLCFFESSSPSQPFPDRAVRLFTGGTDKHEAKIRSHSNSRVTLFSKNWSHAHHHRSGSHGAPRGQYKHEGDPCGTSSPGRSRCQVSAKRHHRLRR